MQEMPAPQLQAWNCSAVGVFVFYAANCSIGVVAHGGYYTTPPMYGHVILNGNTVWQSAWANASIPLSRGVNMMQVNPFTCTLLEPPRQFDTFKLASTQMSSYLQRLGHGVIVVGVTANEPVRNLQHELPTLNSMGVDVSDVQYGGAFAFVAQKDFDQKTALRKTTTIETAASVETDISVTVTGASQIFI